ncbi:hypothetical protein U27_03729 [Candidatus Vecturithrix granuli]|uniref:Uncharacterized protein n=1 Tax=Vecturithrix granuli TaxID=1499967 RepID=A0A081BWR0_VECG1|nr:hypothetical protein U27_03729 [Candidatus Vecturithrix granuli]
MEYTGRRWSVQDRYGNQIYLTQERWQHIIDAMNHPEIEEYERVVKQTLQTGQRRQEPLNPRKYRYSQYYDDLPGDVNTIVVIVLFGVSCDNHGQTHPNNYVVTAFFKHIRPKR